jgi:hypothetical protein
MPRLLQGFQLLQVLMTHIKRAVIMRRQPPHNIPPSAEPPPGVVTIRRVLQCEDACILNLIVDKVRLAGGMRLLDKHMPSRADLLMLILAGLQSYRDVAH